MCYMAGARGLAGRGGVGAGETAERPMAKTTEHQRSAIRTRPMYYKMPCSYYRVHPSAPGPARDPVGNGITRIRHRSDDADVVM